MNLDNINELLTELDEYGEVMITDEEIAEGRVDPMFFDLFLQEWAKGKHKTVLAERDMMHNCVIVKAREVPPEDPMFGRPRSEYVWNEEKRWWRHPDGFTVTEEVWRMVQAQEDYGSRHRMHEPPRPRGSYTYADGRRQQTSGYGRGYQDTDSWFDESFLFRSDSTTTFSWDPQ